MNQIEKIKTISDKVKFILANVPQTRNDDNLLTLKVWALEEPNLRAKDFPFVEFAKRFLDRELPSTESIRRTRQKIQEQYPELRHPAGHLVRKEYAEQMRSEIKGLEV
jgi:hypothetical protein